MNESARTLIPTQLAAVRKVHEPFRIIGATELRKLVAEPLVGLGPFDRAKAIEVQAGLRAVGLAAEVG